ncbi:rRNA methylase [Encephalitozoon hellem ATCC 50504]|uniref:rRNA methyltransferase n=1 Tax=Encephalitozoon hellem TaxID=27973 RepID=A0A9Q9CAI7_ENCHE|nr:rRNA methylase [Encephalitozoon hellem ATCC 50504]AFM98658.1 rRNA methylase [Encephalitozoon hellem ATCC 50504]UTX43607.1 rRNA methyltransferase SPB1 [Encephalitozoon hellem]WEL39082.1 rRNA methyltransferase [Encephalitozoon hellem]|eukprot:XP_003887639.1 rRNA methylase [Encephalitozoon hellem ATCC 50504]
MGKSKSIGKTRLDKYYNLAKEKGYRARSAFKLLQMNRKYGFLGNAHVLIDLCAAPGSWSQVAAQEMPLRRKIVAVDLEPIKFIGDVDTIVEDITSNECRLKLREILGAHKADVVLHDGAPNVGTSWENDAFNQNLLVLHSTKLASEFLKKGGVFVTKVFRSQDYFSLHSILAQLFETVETSKPLSSRSQSAEIFLVCLGFVGEENVDYSVLEPSAVFTEMKDAGGYDDFNFHKKLNFSEFLKEDDPAVLSEMLSKYSEIVVDIDEKDVSKVLEPEFLDMFKDLQLLGKGDIRKVLRKRKKIIQSVRERTIEVPDLDFLRGSENVEEEELKEKSVEEKIEEIQMLIEKKRKKEGRRESISKSELGAEFFFKDSVFDKLNMVGEDEEDGEERDEQEIEISSCSDSLDLDEEEIMCVSRLKENPEGFIEDTIDRYIRDPNEKLPNYLREDQESFYSRPSKIEERRLTKKEKEALNRRKTRAERRAEMFMKNVVVDDSEEEGKIAKKIYKSSFKKTKSKPRIVFPKKGRCGIPRGKGRVVTLDKRMKKDKRKGKH